MFIMLLFFILTAKSMPLQEPISILLDAQDEVTTQTYMQSKLKTMLEETLLLRDNEIKGQKNDIWNSK